MRHRTVVLLLASHALLALVGIAAGINVLPILTTPAGPSKIELVAAITKATCTGQFRPDLNDSVALHWGEGAVSVGSGFMSILGKLAPGPDYKLYLSPEFVETGADFVRLKASKVVGFADLGMEAIYKFDVKDMPVTVAGDASGTSVHQTDPKEWQAKIGKIPVSVA